MNAPRYSILLCLAALLSGCALFSPPKSASPDLHLYISPDGDDKFSGLYPQPNSNRTDGPLATFEAARDKLRKSANSTRTVWIRAGIYPRTQSLQLTRDDSGTPDHPVTWRAYPNEKVLIRGGISVDEFHPVEDPFVLNRLDPAARHYILYADLDRLGLTDLGKLAPRGFGRPITPAPCELFFADQPMSLARWPNSHFVNTTSVPAGPNGGKFGYPGDRPSRWTGAADVWLHGYWRYDWADSCEKLHSIDPAKHEISTEPPHSLYGYDPGRRFYAFNLLEELDSPGEYYLDRQHLLLYFWPPTGSAIQPGQTVLSTLTDPLITLQNVSDITIRDLTFECSRGAGATITAGSKVLFAGCTFRNLGTFALSFTAGNHNGVQSCDIYQTGEGGILLAGGDRASLRPAANFAINNHIHDYARTVFAYRPAINLEGVGNIVSQNLIAEAPHQAIWLRGNDHLIENNEFSHVCMDTSDCGAVYIGRDFTERGNIIRNNLFHDMGRKDCSAIYLDDCASGTIVQNNVAIRTGRGVLLGGGRDNLIDNNVFVECDPAVHIDGRGLDWLKSYFDGSDNTLFDRLRAVHYDSPPYSTRYPALATILTDQPAAPKNNRIIHNIRSAGSWLEIQQQSIIAPLLDIHDNFPQGDPMFISTTRFDYGLLPTSPARALGIKSIQMDTIGLQPDEYRHTVPKAPVNESQPP